MKVLDLLKLSISNLKRRKLRTVLTVLGVLIGTASVVTMLSLGIGLDELNKESIAQSGSLKAIDVSVPYTKQNDTSKKTEPIYIKDETVKSFSKLEHVEGVSPVLSTSVIVMQGPYMLRTQISGVGDDYMDEIKLESGHLPKDKKKLEFVYGNFIIRDFLNQKNARGSFFETNKLPNVDYYKPMFVIFDTEAFEKANAGGENAPKPPKKYIIETAGVVKGGASMDDFSNYNNYSYGIYCNIDALKVMLNKIYKNRPIPDQPTTKKGKPLKYLVYDSAKVYVDDMKNVLSVQKQISEMGYQAESQMEWIEQSKTSTNMIQMVLGGIGAVSLFVASIGIANTMMMSIYERTKEIGIMKVLGCDMNRIRDMFLIESGAIGLIGGLTGVIFSFIISIIINALGVAASVSGVDGDISRIPVWLVIAAIIFAVIIGMLAGFFPSLRAMKLSPLTALRND
ncbi:ABC transporter permease [Lachnoanaerobaculum saburreum]|uniref:Efflux ABC transporter, permease protein n=1 Tax=Lachnoanaerobaculum saburreum DSM 3986 TaxID=887325 RepID=E6LP57_9FIRM|nr:ABC transporter permease [Lachnoanaerobaculum saburreum]EFU76375.1 efflux ABC transporter, permease protein [Lachnoanaerobaculum saburreum DSM 3986]